MDSKLKRTLRNAYKQGAWGQATNYAAAVCTQNARIRAKLDQLTVDGEIGVIHSGMDCDCTQYYHEYKRSSWTSVAAYKQWFEQHEQGLDGPCSTRLISPLQVEPRNLSRDLALMAYEDGHPSVVYPVGLSEMMPY